MTTIVGRHGAPSKHRRTGLLGLGLLGFGVVASAVAWVVLVRGAIVFGADAKSGESAAWAFMTVATVGAAACLLLGMALVTRAASMAGIGTGYEPKRARRS